MFKYMYTVMNSDIHVIFLRLARKKERKTNNYWTGKNIANHYWHCASVSTTVEEFRVHTMYMYYYLIIGYLIMTHISDSLY